MQPLPISSTDAELIAFVDQWVELLERQDFEAAFALTDLNRFQGWTPDLIREVIESYGEERPDQRVTLVGESTDRRQRKEVDRWPENRIGEIGMIWYDLNLNGESSDLTATFRILRVADGLSIRLDDIHVM